MSQASGACRSCQQAPDAEPDKVRFLQIGSALFLEATLKNRIRPFAVTSLPEAEDCLKKIGVEPYGIASMGTKMSHLNLLIEGLKPKVANIIKQEMPRWAAMLPCRAALSTAASEQTDVLIMGTGKQVLRFIEKVAFQPFG